MRNALYVVLAFLLGPVAALPLDNGPGLMDTRSMLHFPVAKEPLRMKSIIGPSPPYRLHHRQADLTEVLYDRSFLVEVAFGDQIVDLIADTGSSNAWAIALGYTCEPRWPCKFGPSVSVEKSFDVVSGRHMNSTYADGSYINGIVANVPLSIAGITIPGQTVGLATLAAFVGDGTSSGLIGLGRNAGASLFAGSSPSTDSWPSVTHYSSVINTVFADALAPPMFSMAVSRDLSGTGFGGYLTIGGIIDISDPHVNASSTYATVDFLPDPGTSTVSGYAIQYDGLAWSGGGSTVPHRTIVDSGTIFIYIPKSDAAAVNALFDPPAKVDRQGLYEVACNAVPPHFAVVIEGIEFPIDHADMGWYSSYGGVCYSAVQSSGFIGANILGDPFMRSVLAVYDWGSGQMHIASREYYES